MATLRIGRTDSTCENCRKAADPSDRGHFINLGYGPDNGTPGCGEKWTDAYFDFFTGADVEVMIEATWLPDYIKELLRRHYDR